ncbi:hypothetical protein DVH05_007619 [Phytophthora capsici]|nr:hypothetical protein DVH05_013117 [Phytophthora capsici]KAG1685917.1 hypothetical protein DVH05_007619 [Phytophthora capsici]
MPRLRGYRNYSKQEQQLLMVILEENVPTSTSEWKEVSALYNLRREPSWSDRSAISLHRKFSSLASPSNRTADATLRGVARKLKVRMHTCCLVKPGEPSFRQIEDGSSDTDDDAVEILGRAVSCDGTSQHHANGKHGHEVRNSNAESVVKDFYRQIVELALKAQSEVEKYEEDRQQREHLERECVRQRQEEIVSLITELVKTKTE